MARKGQVSIQDSVEENDEFENYLNAHYDQLICMEVYSDFCGYCAATSNAVRKAKLEIGQDNIAMVRVLADRVDALARFRDKSEPTFLFIYQGKLTRAMFGSNGIELCRIVEEELRGMFREKETGIPRPKREIFEMLPEEADKLEDDLKMEQERLEEVERLRVLTVAARKKRVCQRMAVTLKELNFILFWPHCHQAHFDLYEKWDVYNISVGAKETVQMTEEGIKEAFYMSDVDPNEACVYALMKGEALIVLFKMSEGDNRDFVRLLRHALYEEIPVPKEDTPPEKQLPPIPAYERYATISKTAREVRRERYEAYLEKLRLEREERERLAAEQARLAREAAEEAAEAEKRRQEEERFARIQAGLPADPEPEELGEGETELGDEEKVEEEAKVEEEQEVVEEFHSDVEVEGEEYIPPGGLFVPGLYAPPNELAKSNALAYFFPKIVAENVKIESEHLPPHVLVMFSVDKRQDLLEVIEQFPEEILNMGFFLGEDPFHCEHIAYTIKHYNSMERKLKHHDRMALMVSRKRSLPLLQLAGFNPCYISSSAEAGERDCLAMFPVGYADDYYEEPSIVEEEIEEVVAEPEPEPEVPAEADEPPPPNPEEDEED